MNALPHKAFEGPVDHAVLFDARFPAERLGRDLHQKVALTLGVRSTMARVMMRLIDHFQMAWCESA